LAALPGSVFQILGQKVSLHLVALSLAAILARYRVLQWRKGIPDLRHTIDSLSARAVALVSGSPFEVLREKLITANDTSGRAEMSRALRGQEFNLGTDPSGVKVLREVEHRLFLKASPPSAKEVGLRAVQDCRRTYSALRSSLEVKYSAVHAASFFVPLVLIIFGSGLGSSPVSAIYLGVVLALLLDALRRFVDPGL
jgi:hypothetical protein